MLYIFAVWLLLFSFFVKNSGGILAFRKTMALGRLPPELKAEILNIFGHQD